ncbi:15555_t:CDS:2 [Funneliformis geosporum]|nr:15555_t:CDS:2 [Funneliformis geosporum]
MTQTLTHDNPAGGVGRRVLNTGYIYSFVAENVAVGYSTNQEVGVMNLWMNSPRHRENILNPVFTNLGVAFCGGTYWTQVFASPRE